MTKVKMLVLTAMLAMTSAVLTPKDLPTYDFEEMFGHDFDNPFFRGDHNNNNNKSNKDLNEEKKEIKWDDFSKLGSELDAKFAKEDEDINNKTRSESRKELNEQSKELKATLNEDISTENSDIFQDELFGADFEKHFTTSKENFDHTITTEDSKKIVEVKNSGEKEKIKESKKDDFFQRDLFGADFQNHFTTEKETLELENTFTKTEIGLKGNPDESTKKKDDYFFQRDLFGADFENHFTTTKEIFEPSITTEKTINVPTTTNYNFDLKKDENQRDLFGADFEEHFTTGKHPKNTIYSYDETTTKALTQNINGKIENIETNVEKNEKSDFVVDELFEHDFEKHYESTTQETTTLSTTTTTRRRRLRRPWLRQLVRMLAHRALSNRESRLEEERRRLRPIVTEKPVFRDDTSSDGGAFWPILSLLSGNLFQRHDQKGIDVKERGKMESANHVSKIDPNEASLNTAVSVVNLFSLLFPVLLYNLVL